MAAAMATPDPRVDEGLTVARTISGVLNTLNAGRTLDLAIQSLKPWVDELIVVDMESDDATREIAERFGAQVYSHPRLSHVEPARRFAISQATGEWVMLLDADEVVPPRLAERLRRFAEESEGDVAIIPWRNFFFGMEVRHGTFGPRFDYHARFFRRDALVWNDDIHAVPTAGPGSKQVHLDVRDSDGVLHFAYRDVSEFVQKTNRYTDVEAHAPGPVGVGNPRRVIRQAAVTFLRSYLRRAGYKDGWVGLHTASMLACYQLIAAAKKAQVAEFGSAERAEVAYRELATSILSGYS